MSWKQAQLWCEMKLEYGTLVGVTFYWEELHSFSTEAIWSSNRGGPYNSMFWLNEQFTEEFVAVTLLDLQTTLEATLWSCAFSTV